MVTYNHYHSRKGLLAPNAEMWRALAGGHLLRQILTDFYTQVYADAALSPFFANVTMDRIIDKQFSFLRSIFTGEKCYFGDHPKNAHHWMVISEQLFDYRALLIEKSMRKYDLPEHLILYWLKLESVFRKVIVKDKPIPRRLGKLELPLDGYSSLTLKVSSLCDCCGNEIPCDTLGYYHRRTGKLYCTICHIQTNQPEQILQSTVDDASKME